MSCANARLSLFSLPLPPPSLPPSLPSSQTLEELMSDPKVRLMDSLRLGLLYCLRYEGSTKGDLTKVERLLVSRGHTEEDKRVGVASKQLHWTSLSLLS